MSIDGRLIEILRKEGIENFFPIQEKVIPTLIRARFSRTDLESYENSDCLVAAATGEGKTLCYVIPILHHLLNSFRAQKTYALIVVPTHELGHQIAEVFEKYQTQRKIVISRLLGDSTLEEDKNLLKKKPEVVVATPGRLQDHLHNVDTSSLTWIVLDEADRLLQTGCFPNLPESINFLTSQRKNLLAEERKKLDSVCQNFLSPSKIQKILLSATMTTNSKKLAKLNLDRILYFTHGNQQIPKNLKNLFWRIESKLKKPLYLVSLFSEIFEKNSKLSAEKILIFTKSKEKTRQIQKLLFVAKKQRKWKIKFAEFSSNLTDFQRRRNLQKFKTGKIQILISSDAAARGIDVEEIDLVLNYDLPTKLVGYLHRIGRTARARKKGLSLSLCTPNELGRLRKFVDAEEIDFSLIENFDSIVENFSE